MTRLPRKVNVASIARTSAFETELAPTESLFGRWSRYCLHHRPDVRELDREFAPASANARVLTSTLDEAEWRAAMAREGKRVALVGPQATAARLLGLSPGESIAASGVGLCSPHAQSIAMAGDLRACWACMALGFHSILFQHYAMRCCPLHGSRLSCACPRCERRSVPRFRCIADRPFTCAKCDELWLRTAMPAYESRYLALAGAMLGDRMREIFPLAAAAPTPLIDQADCRALAKSPRDIDSASHCRQVARWTTWPALASDRWVSFIERRHVLFDWSAQPNGYVMTARSLSSHDATACLRALINVCDRLGYSRDGILLNSSLGICPNGLRLDDRASVVAVALHQTVCKYGQNGPKALQWVRKGVDRTYYCALQWNGLQLGRGLISSDSGNAQLVVAEILGYFAASIVESAKLKYLHDVDWEAGVCRTQFLPAWLVVRSGLHHVLRVRERASERSILRLIRRYPPTVKLRGLSNEVAPECEGDAPSEPIHHWRRAIDTFSATGPGGAIS